MKPTTTPSSPPTPSAATSHADYTLVQADATAPTATTTTTDGAAASSTSTSPPPIPRLAVTWQDVSFTVDITDPATTRAAPVPILRGVSGEALPGELLVIMGPSGAGKSSLLDCLANRNAAAAGVVRVNGAAWDTALTKRACYVLQDDLFYANLTVQEHLMLQAELRMGAHVPAHVRAARVAEILSELGLTKVAHSPIGDVHVKGLSGGQRKRLALATELLTNPSILFVDEPTSGLDSFMAETVVRQMQALARKGRTIVATIHQPSSAMFGLFDKLHLLVGGRTVYRGPARDGVAYFASQGLPCPAFVNPADFFMEQLVARDEDGDAAARVARLLDAWPAHEARAAISVITSAAGTAMTPCADDSAREGDHRDGGGATTNGVRNHVRVLCRRNLLRLVRDAVAFRARVASTIIMATICGLVFLQLEVSQTGIQDFTGVMFFLAVSQFIFSANPEFITVPLEIPIVLREHNGRLYHVLSWYAAKNLSELPFQLVYPMLFLLPAYFLVGFQHNFEMFFTFYLFIVLVASSATGMGYMISCGVKRVDLAPTVGLLLLLPFLLFGGLFINSESTPVYFVWAQQISPIKYGFHGLMRAFWTKVPSIDCPPAGASAAPCRATSGLAVLASNNIATGTDALARDCLILVAINVGFRLTGALLLWRRVARRAL